MSICYAIKYIEGEDLHQYTCGNIEDIVYTCEICNMTFCDECMYNKCSICDKILHCNDCSWDIIQLYGFKAKNYCINCDIINYYKERRLKTQYLFKIIDEELMIKTCHPSRLEWTLDDDDKRFLNIDTR
tara:strand:- start:650 stop:1036 length:387 start_codon:yes stop_codon:yes gene_type:complete